MRVLIIGAGFMGTLHARAIRPSAADVCIVDSDPLRAEQLAHQVGGQVGPDIETALQRFSPDMAVIAGPDNTHLDHLRVLYRAGVPVLVEKPAVAGAAQCELAREMTRSPGPPLMPGHILRFDQSLAQAATDVADGAVGQVLHVFASRWGKRGRGAMVSHTTTPLWHFAVHDIDLIHWMSSATIASVQGAVQQRRGETSEFSALGTLTNGATFTVSAGWILPDDCPPQYLSELQVHGTEGMISVRTDHQGYQAMSTSGTWGQRNVGWPEVDGRPHGPLMAEQQHFMSKLRAGEPFRVTFDDGLAAVAGAAKIEEALGG